MYVVRVSDLGFLASRLLFLLYPYLEDVKYISENKLVFAIRTIHTLVLLSVSTLI